MTEHKMFKPNTLQLAVYLLSATLFLSSCRRDNAEETTNDPTPTEDLDIQIRALLENASPNGAVGFFKMPSSNDYSAIPQDPMNPLNAYKVQLGQMLFHETRLAGHPMDNSAMYTYSCASCHHAPAGFQAGIAQGLGEGGWGYGSYGEGRHRNPIAAYDDDTYLDVQPIRTPSAMNGAYQKNQLWNGQFGATNLNVGTEASWTAGTPKETNFLGFEGLETQAIAGMGVHRLACDTMYFLNNPTYNYLFNQAFASLPQDQRISKKTMGLAIAAYERTLLANQSPWQFYLQGDFTALNDQEKRGAILFFGDAGCVSCHTGPALNSMDFYALGLGNLEMGNYGVEVSDPSKPEHKGRGGFTGNAADMHKFKVPQLYNLKDSPFYGHGATIHSIREMVEYKNNANPENPNVPYTQISSQFHPLGLTADQIDDITAFLSEALYDPYLNRYVPISLPSGQCFPNADTQSQIDMGCFQ